MIDTLLNDVLFARFDGNKTAMAKALGTSRQRIDYLLSKHDDSKIASMLGLLCQLRPYARLSWTQLGAMIETQRKGGK